MNELNGRREPAPESIVRIPEEHLDALREFMPSREDVLREAREQTERERRRRVLMRGVLPAMLVAAVAATLWWDPVLDSEHLQTVPGEQLQRTLPDGGSVQLNTATELLVHKRLRSLQIKLVRGEAAFVAAHDWKPFIVQAGDMRIRDIGTAFNVRRVGGSAQVLVTEGAVEVQRGTDRLVLRQGQFIGAQPPGERLKLAQPPQPNQATAWQQGRIVFDGTPLAQAVGELQRYRVPPLHLAADPSIERLRLTGDYDVQGVEALIDALPQVLPLSVKRMPDGEVRISARR